MPPIVHEVLRSPGQPLDATTRAFMEPRFARDFSRVRLHRDVQAAESARAVNALAYTVGHDVVFGAGRYVPGTTTGRRLLAHELAHVTQIGATAIEGKLEIARPGDTYEQEADRVADRIVRAHAPLLKSPVPNHQVRRPRAPSGMVFTYRNKRAFNFGRLDETVLKEDEFTDSKTQPWIERIKLRFDGTKADSASDLVATGTLEATYSANNAALPAIAIGVVGGSTRLGLTDKGSGFKVHRIEGVGYSEKTPPDPEGTSWPKSRYSKSLDASMHYGVFFKGGQAIHGGSLDTGSHSCIHVDWTDLHHDPTDQLHSVIGKTKVDVAYDATALTTLCCSRMKILGVTRKGDARNPCRNEDPKVCP